MDVKEFPAFPGFKDDNKLNIDSSILSDGINKTIKAVSQDATRPVLTGALLVIDKDFTLVATDSYRLAKYSADIKSKIKIEALIPLQSLEEILKLIEGHDSIVLSVDNSLLKVETKQAVFITRLLEGQFPNYDQVIPKDYKTTITCKKAALVDAIKQASLVADKNRGFTIEDGLTIRAATAQIGEVESIIDAVMSGEIEKTVFNAQYFLDGLANIKDVEIHYNGPTNPSVFKDENYLYMIMPIRLS
jgi:DNA polymerase-3 subunit beta